jgi:hypothetical protein
MENHFLSSNDFSSRSVNKSIEQIDESNKLSGTTSKQIVINDDKDTAYRDLEEYCAGLREECDKHLETIQKLQTKCQNYDASLNVSNMHDLTFYTLHTHIIHTSYKLYK